MMTPTAYVVSILSENVDKIPGLKDSGIFAFYINGEINDDVYLLVSETVGLGDEFGNDEILASNKRVQIDLYYPKDYQEDMSVLEQSLKRVLRDKRVYCYSDAGHVLTLDSMNITNTLKFNLKMEE